MSAYAPTNLTFVEHAPTRQAGSERPPGEGARARHAAPSERRVRRPISAYAPTNPTFAGRSRRADRPTAGADRERGRAPSAVVSVSDNGLTFTDVGTVPPSGAVDVARTARYVALTTTWSRGDAALTSLRVLD